MPYLVLLLLFTATLSSPLHAAYTIRNGKLMNKEQVPVYSAERHYQIGLEALEGKDYREAAKNFNIVVLNFPNSSVSKESQYFLGVAYFLDEEYDFANDAFNAYLQCDSSPKHFEEAVGYKLEIARAFHCGARKRFFGTKMLPKLAPARHHAVEVYNEVIAALPCHEYAAQALYSKGCLHWEDQCFKESVESFQTLIRRFPKHELSPEAYLCINRVYLEQAEVEFQNPDILSLAQINARKFQTDFPKEERLEEASCDVQNIKEMYAKGLFDTAQFYERKDKPQAAIIYYKSAIKQFPDTTYACRAEARLRGLAREMGDACDICF